MSYQEEELKGLGFPPRISIDVTPMTSNSQPLKLQVEGLSIDCAFDLSPGISTIFYSVIIRILLFHQIISSLKLIQLQCLLIQLQYQYVQYYNCLFMYLKIIESFEFTM